MPWPPGLQVPSESGVSLGEPDGQSLEREPGTPLAGLWLESSGHVLAGQPEVSVATALLRETDSPE